MRTYTRLAFTAFVATVAMAAVVGSASAGRFLTSNQAFRVTYKSLEFLSFIAVRCEATLEGSFHARTVVKRLRSLIGHVTRVIVKRPCINGETFAYNGFERLEEAPALLNTLPWQVLYEGFGGVLPNILSVRLGLSGARFRIGALGVLCIATTGLARGLAFGTATRTLITGIIDNLRASGTIRYDEGSSPICGEAGSLASAANDGIITLLGTTTTKITILLI